jgi:hypothetical protein
MMTCNGKAASKVMGWGMILKMIISSSTGNEGRDYYGRDRLRSPGIATV